MRDKREKRDKCAVLHTSAHLSHIAHIAHIIKYVCRLYEDNNQEKGGPPCFFLFLGRTQLKRGDASSRLCEIQAGWYSPGKNR